MDGIKNPIKKINRKPGDYDAKCMKIKFNSGDNLPLNKVLKIHNMTIVFRSVSQEGSKYYPQVFLDERLCKL